MVNLKTASLSELVEFCKQLQEEGLDQSTALKIMSSIMDLQSENRLLKERIDRIKNLVANS